MSLAASAGAAVAHAARARHTISSSAIIVVVVVIIIIAHEESSRVWAAPTATVQPAPAPSRSPFALPPPRTTAATAAAAEPDPRPAALHASPLRHAVLSHRRDTMAAAAAASVAPSATADGARVDNVTRLHGGDVFNAYDAEICITDTCVGLSSGTAGLFPKNDLNDARKYRPDAVDCRCQCLPHMTTFREDLNICVDDVHECTLAPFVSGSTAEKIPFVFLPLRGQIIHPSKEISFQGVKSPICAVSGAQYLTPAGWMELRSPIDTDVPFRLFRDEGRTFLQWLGEADLRHKMQGRLVLVHLMCRDMSAKSVVHVSPEDNGNGYASGQSAPLVGQQNQNIFSPCVAFRVVGQPIKMTNNVTEVSFQPETQTTAITSTIGLSTKEYVAITICSLLLGLIYVASVLLYLYVKKRKGGTPPSTTGASSTAGTGTSTAIGNEQVHFGTGFSRTSSMQSAFGGKIRDGNSFIGDTRRESLRMQQHAASAAAAAAVASVVTSGSGAPPGYGRHGLLSSGLGLSVEDHGVVKNNPLLKHYPNFDGPPEFPSDMSNSNSECGDDDMLQQYQAQRMHHMHHHGDVVDGIIGSPMMDGKKTNSLSYGGEDGDEYENDAVANSGGETECLPEENVSIVEDLSANDKLENMKAIVNGTLRRKLYFNPAYFEPHLLLSPPAAAIEFLNKIREVISIAKYKMATKRYQPSLNMIPEEGRSDGHLHQLMRHGGLDTATSPTDSEAYQLHSAAAHHRATNNSSGMQTPSSRCKSSASSGTSVSCVGCPGCASASEPPQGDAASAAHTNRADCRNCGDKRNSIRKWLEDVSNHGDASQTRGGNGGLDADAENEHNILDKLLDMPLLDALPEHGESVTPTAGRTMEKRAQIESSGSDTDTIRANSLDSKLSQKRMAPAPPQATAPPTPKIISHYLKQDICKPSNNEQQLEINNNNHNMRYSIQNGGGQSFGGNSNNGKIYDKIELLTQLTQTAVVGELFNNPQFKHHPCDSHEIDGSSSAAFTTANNTTVATSGSDYEVMQNIKQHMPDMIYEAMAKDYSKRKILATTTHHQSLSPRHTLLMQLPHPDYDDGSLSKKYDEIPSYVHVPTPDYNTFGRSKNNPQPDSPIYKRKSPHHLIVDYETDSLERHSTAHRRHSGGSNSQTPVTTPAQTMNRMAGRTASLTPTIAASNVPRTTSSSPSTTTTTTTGGSSSEASSQPSPSLSTALPLEEELEIRNTIYDRAIGYRKDVAAGSGSERTSSSRISFANLLQAQTNNDNGRAPALPAKQPRIQYNTPSHGSMTIEVEHSPSEYELSTDSEQFEPDTLDRKAARRASVCSATTAGNGGAVVNLWSQHLTKFNDPTTIRHSSMENISSLPADVHIHSKQQKQPLQKMPLVLRSSGSFKSNSLSNFPALNVPGNPTEPQLQKDFNSLREIYEAKNIAQTKMSSDSARSTPKPSAAAAASIAAAAAAERDREMGRLLTLEARHSRRQRQTGGTLKKSIPPDVVPNGSAADKHNAACSSIYDMPRTPAAELHPKGFSGWNTGNSLRSQAASNRTATTTSDEGDDRHDLDKDGDTHSHNSSEAATEVTGVSDTHNNSDSATSRWRRHRRENGVATTETTTSATSTAAASSRPYSIVNKTRAPAAPQNGAGSAAETNHVPSIEILRNFMSMGLSSSGGNNPLLAGDMSDFSDTSTIKSGSTNFLYQSTAKRDQTGQTATDELDKIEIVSSKSLSVHSVPLSRDQDTHSDYEQMQQQQHHRQSAPEANNNDAATIDHEQLLYDLTRPANRFHYSQPQPPATTTASPSSPDHHHAMLMASTKVFRCEVNPSSHGMQIALGLKDRVKKTKDLKYAWKRFVNIATSKFHTANNSNSNSPTGTTTIGSTSARMLLDDRQSMLSDADDGIASINDDASIVVHQSGQTAATTSATTQKTGRASAAFSLVSRTPSNNSERSASGSRVLGGRHDPDSGYMSADSSESKLNSKRLYERFNFRGSRPAAGTATTATSAVAQQSSTTDDATAIGHNSNLQDIKETSAEQEGVLQIHHQKPSVTGFIPKRSGMGGELALSIDPIEVFSSDSSERSTDDDECDNDDDDPSESGGMDDDMCGSGAESVETNSVFFKNVRKAPAPPQTK